MTINLNDIGIRHVFSMSADGGTVNGSIMVHKDGSALTYEEMLEVWRLLCLGARTDPRYVTPLLESPAIIDV